MPTTKELISDSQLAFLNQQNETALELANQAIAFGGKNLDAYNFTGNAQVQFIQKLHTSNRYNGFRITVPVQ